MASNSKRTATYPVGIDLGTTYSCLSYLTPQGQPVTLPNAEGELSTPSVVLFDGDEVVVGTEALRHSVAAPERVVQFAKRHMGDPHKCWVIDGQVYRPKDISTFILKKLLQDASEQLGPIRQAVITVPAQFSELQRQDTVEAGLAAGLEHVDIIHEPVAAALCYVLGEGMWFAELANEQTVLVFDLGGGTFDLSLVKYNQREVRVLASGGDLNLGGLDWNHALEEFACDEFIKSSISDPRLDRESMQALAIEVEQVKRSLSVRPKSALVVQHEGRRKVYSIEREHFELLTRPLLDRTEKITRELLQQNKLGWAHVDAILATGGASRMPMVRNMLQRIGGTTLNQTLSPDQSICHGAAYYSGMLLSTQRVQKSVLDQRASGRLASFRQQSVSGRSLGILVRDMQTQQRHPHYLLPANTPLPCAYQQRFGTVIPNQKKVHLHIVESGQTESDPWVELGECVIDGLPEKLPISSPIEVTIRYDEQARVHVEAVVISSGQRAQTTLVRPPVSAPSPAEQAHSSTVRQKTPPAPAHPASSQKAVSGPDQFALLEESPPSPPKVTPPAPARPIDPRLKKASPASSRKPDATVSRTPHGKPVAGPKRTAPATPIEDSERPLPLCNTCGEPLNAKLQCPICSASSQTSNRRPRKKPVKSGEDATPTERLQARPAISPQMPKVRGSRKS